MATEVLVIDYTTTVQEITLSATANPQRGRFMSLMTDINTAGRNLSQFDAEAIDSLSPFADEALSYVVAMNNRKDVQIQDYNIAIEKMKEIFNAIFSHGKHFVMSAHLQSETDVVTGRGRVVPLVWGKTLPSKVPQSFSEVFMTQTIPNPKAPNGTDYLWLTRPDGFVNFLGSRLRDDLSRMVPQNFEDLAGGGKRIRSLVVGESHTGKTRSVGTLPGKVIMYALEPDGWESLRVPFKVVKPPLSEVWK
jgi:hypothetical protein